MEEIETAAKAAAWHDVPRDDFEVDGVVDIEETSSLGAIVKEIIELQKAADGTLESSRKLLTKLYIYEYLHSLQAASNTDVVAEEDSNELVTSLCDILGPIPGVVHEIDLEKDPLKGLPATPHLAVFKSIARISLSILRVNVSEQTLSSDKVLRQKLAIAIGTHSDISVEWVTEENAQICRAILDTHTSVLISEDILVEYLLKSVVKPLFGKGPKTITEQGRKAMRVPENKRTTFTFADEQPWTKEKPEALTLLRFSIRNLKQGSVKDHWHLIVPPILTTLDEGDVPSKAYACEILEDVIRSVDAGFLSRTGLGSVFEEAVSPCLHYLPPMTPINHAARSFRAAFATLLTLSRYRYVAVERDKMFESVDKILREGIFHGMMYAADNVQMETVFIEEARVVVRILGIRSVRHLKKLISLCTTPMMSPFITAYPALAFQATATLVEVIRDCWPRISDYNTQILKAVLFCYLRALEGDENDATVRTLRAELRVVTRLLQEVNKENDSWFEKAREGAIERDQRFQALFDVTGAVSIPREH